ncbi:MAG: tetratricopeptide repeat protein [Bacteroidota bacterium]
MRNSIFIFLLLLLAACNQPSGPSVDELSSSYQELTDEETGLLHPERSRAFIEEAKSFSQASPENDEASEWLFKAGEVAQGIQDNNLALELYQQILQEFPDGDRAADATFMIAFTYDENFNDSEKAREYYDLFLEKYPDDEFADDAQILLEMLPQ